MRIKSRGRIAGCVFSSAMDASPTAPGPARFGSRADGMCIRNAGRSICHWDLGDTEAGPFDRLMAGTTGRASGWDGASASTKPRRFCRSDVCLKRDRAYAQRGKKKRAKSPVSCPSRDCEVRFMEMHVPPVVQGKPGQPQPSFGTLDRARARYLFRRHVIVCPACNSGEGSLCPVALDLLRAAKD